MTFTNTADAARCDDCGTTVGRSWRAKAGHLCPRTVAPLVLHVRTGCEYCGRPLTQRATEAKSDFYGRRFCDRSCAARGRA